MRGCGNARYCGIGSGYGVRVGGVFCRNRVHCDGISRRHFIRCDGILYGHRVRYLRISPGNDILRHCRGLRRGLQLREQPMRPAEDD